jgi:hypothetical protein
MNKRTITQIGGLRRSSKLKRRDLLRSGAFIGAALASANLFGVRKASAQAVTMRLGSDSPMGDEHNVGFVKLKEEVESTTNGRIKVVIFPDAQLGSNEAMNNAMKAGTLDGVMSDVRRSNLISGGARDGLIQPAVPVYKHGARFASGKRLGWSEAEAQNRAGIWMRGVGLWH